MITTEEQKLRQLRVNIADLAYAISHAVEVYAPSFHQDVINDLERIVRDMGTLALDAEVYESMDSFHNIMNALHDKDRDRGNGGSNLASTLDALSLSYSKSDAEQIKEIKIRQDKANRKNGTSIILTDEQIRKIIANRRRLLDEDDEELNF